MSNIIEITDFNDPNLDVFARLTEAQLRNKVEPEKGIFIAESAKVILAALKAGWEPVSMLMSFYQSGFLPKHEVPVPLTTWLKE